MPGQKQGYVSLANGASTLEKKGKAALMPVVDKGDNGLYPATIILMVLFTVGSCVLIPTRFYYAANYSCINTIGEGKSDNATYAELGFFGLLTCAVVLLLLDRPDRPLGGVMRWNRLADKNGYFQAVFGTLRINDPSDVSYHSGSQSQSAYAQPGAPGPAATPRVNNPVARGYGSTDSFNPVHAPTPPRDHQHSSNGAQPVHPIPVRPNAHPSNSPSGLSSSAPYPASSPSTTTTSMTTTPTAAAATGTAPGSASARAAATGSRAHVVVPLPAGAGLTTNDAASGSRYPDINGAEKGTFTIYALLLVSSFLTAVHLQHIESSISEGILGSNYIWQFAILTMRYFCLLGILYRFTRLIHEKGANSEDCTKPMMWMFMLLFLYTVTVSCTELAVKVKCALHAGEGDPEQGSLVDEVAKVFLTLTSFFEFSLLLLSFTMVNSGRRIHDRKRRSLHGLTALFDGLIERFPQWSVSQAKILRVFYVFRIALLMALSFSSGDSYDGMHHSSWALHGVTIALGFICCCTLLVTNGENANTREEWMRPDNSFYFLHHNLFKTFFLFVVGFCGLLTCNIASAVRNWENFIFVIRNFFCYLPMLLAFPNKSVSNDGYILLLHGIYSACVLCTNFYHVAYETTSTVDMELFFTEIAESMLCFTLFSMLVWHVEWEGGEKQPDSTVSPDPEAGSAAGESEV